MAFTADDLHSASKKLASLDFSEAETEAVASFLSADGEDEVAGFSFEPVKGDKGTGFLLEVSGMMKPPGKNWSWGASQPSSFAATDDLAI